jgi:DNA polymerase I-like protein with 3'-5' exonuclease and polymerase domains
MSKITFALDFETFYSKDVSVTTLGPRGYFSHPEFDAYLVTVVGDNGYKYAGDPRKFDWHVLKDNIVVCHNAQFDIALYHYGVEQGWYPEVSFESFCSADMCAFLGLPRSLKKASATVLKLAMDKDTRSAMRGHRWENMDEDFRKRVVDYAITDAEICLKLWQEKSPEWPEQERRISLLNREVSERGIPIDVPLLEKSLIKIRQVLFDTESQIPWVGEQTPLSRKAFNAQCRKQGITPPKSLAQDNPDADAWYKTYLEQCPWAKAVSDYRRINTFASKLEAFDMGTMTDGRYYGGFLYFGANPTGRFSGGGASLNLQNLPREEMFGVNFRHLIRPKQGHKLIIADLSQIEVRTLAWLSGDKKAMKLIRESSDIYHGMGILLGMHDEANGELREYDKKTGRGIRHKIKATVLGCGYQMSAARFAVQNNISLEEATVAVDTYRSKMKPVVDLWHSTGNDMNMSQSLGVPYRVKLPSGRVLDYGVLRKMRAANGRFNLISKLVRMGGVRDTKVYSGHVVENMSQALARDIFSDMLLRLDRAGLPIIMHVHDEVIIEVPETEAEESLAKTLSIMSEPPDWIPDIPVAAEGQIADFYSK